MNMNPIPYFYLLLYYSIYYSSIFTVPHFYYLLLIFIYLICVNCRYQLQYYQQQHLKQDIWLKEGMISPGHGRNAISSSPETVYIISQTQKYELSKKIIRNIFLLFNRLQHRKEKLF